MNIQKITEILTSSGIEYNEAVIEVRMLIEHFCNYTRTDIIMGRPLDYEKLKIVEQKAHQRARTKEPIQYIIGKAYFMGNFYKVTKDVLIPRDETEIVVRHALNIIKCNNLKTVLDIGVGTGCISCTLSGFGCDVCGIDISERALNIAKENALNLHQKIEFIKSDLFSNLPYDRKFDLIVSNPPYIPKGTELQQEVLFEPDIALFTNDKDGVEFYQKIITSAKAHLNVNGYIVFELGINQAELVKQCFEKNNFKNIKIEKDLAGIDRVISAQI